jgi:hypothetical protein
MAVIVVRKAKLKKTVRSNLAVLSLAPICYKQKRIAFCSYPFSFSGF